MSPVPKPPQRNNTATTSNTVSITANSVIDSIRRHVQVKPEILAATKERRDRVRELARSHPAARAAYNSGSIAHGTVNAPISDADTGVVLDRRKYPDFGPDGNNQPPTGLLESFRDWILPQLREDFPNVECDITKRALLFEFHEPLSLEGDNLVDPSVDLIIGLDRRGADGLWIPNTQRPGWDPSDPQRHTDLFLDTAKELRVHRARVIRLAKVAVKNDGDHKVLISFNIEALALGVITEVAPIAGALCLFLHRAADEIAQGPTPDPAGVAPPIKLPDGVTREHAAARLRELATIVEHALHVEEEAAVRRVLEPIFGPQLEEMREQEAQNLRQRLKRGAPVVAAPLLSSGFRPGRSYGDAT